MRNDKHAERERERERDEEEEEVLKEEKVKTPGEER